MKNIHLVSAVLAAFLLAAASVLQAAEGDPAAGKRKSQACVACHGTDGNSPVTDFPKIAGQHYDYLLKSLKDYKSGARKSPVMAPLVANLTQRDLEDLAAFYSSQRGLVTKY